MYVAKIRAPEFGKAALKGAKIKQQRLENEQDEEEIEQTKASNIEFGNYMTENSPNSIVKAEDENENGKIDPDEESNALVATGRKYKAHEEIRTDTEQSKRRNQVMAHQAAAEARRIKNAQRVDKERVDIEQRNEQSELQTKQIRDGLFADLKKMGITGDRALNMVNVAMEKEDIREAIYSQLDFTEQLKVTENTTAEQHRMWSIGDAYNKAYGEGKPEELKAANKAALAVLNPFIESLQGVRAEKEKEGDTVAVEKADRTIATFKGILGEDGRIDFQLYERAVGEIAARKQSEKKTLDNQESKKVISNLVQKNKKGKSTETAVQKNMGTDEEIEAKKPEDRTQVEKNRRKKNYKAAGNNVASAKDMFKIQKELNEDDYTTDEKVLDKKTRIMKTLIFDALTTAKKNGRLVSSERLYSEVQKLYESKYDKEGNRIRKTGNERRQSDPIKETQATRPTKQRKSGDSIAPAHGKKSYGDSPEDDGITAENGKYVSFDGKWYLNTKD